MRVALRRAAARAIQVEAAAQGEPART
jgi:hypothetical protein